MEINPGLHWTLESMKYCTLIKYPSLVSSSASFLTAGTTATVAMLRDGVELVVGSVGDSRAMVCRKGQANKLTKDHTPDRKDELHRYTFSLQQTLFLLINVLQTGSS